jgi:hypothetical protein
LLRLAHRGFDALRQRLVLEVLQQELLRVGVVASDVGMAELDRTGEVGPVVGRRIILDRLLGGCDVGHVAVRDVVVALLEVLLREDAVGRGVVDPRCVAATLDVGRADVEAEHGNHRGSDEREGEGRQQDCPAGEPAFVVAAHRRFVASTHGVSFPLLFPS